MGRVPTQAALAPSATRGHIGAMLDITLNGEPRQVAAGISVAAMIAQLGLDPARVAVERNREIVARSTLANVVVAAGDQFEIVEFVGGG